MVWKSYGSGVMINLSFVVYKSIPEGQMVFFEFPWNELTATFFDIFRIGSSLSDLPQYFTFLFEYIN